MDNLSENSNVNVGDFEELSFGFGFEASLDENVGEKQNDVNVDKEEQNTYNVDESYRRITKLTAEDIWGLEFDSEAKAIEFYHKYAQCYGFVMRRDNVGCNLKGNVNMRQLVCNTEGLRDKKHLERLDRVRDHKPISRTDCQARIRVHVDYKTRKWKVIAFEEFYNHELTTPRFVHLIPAYRGMSYANKAQVNSLRSFGVRTCHIMGYMVT